MTEKRSVYFYYLTKQNERKTIPKNVFTHTCTCREKNKLIANKKLRVSEPHSKKENLSRKILKKPNVLFLVFHNFQVWKMSIL